MELLFAHDAAAKKGVIRDIAQEKALSVVRQTSRIKRQSREIYPLHCERDRLSSTSERDNLIAVCARIQSRANSRVHKCNSLRVYVYRDGNLVWMRPIAPFFPLDLWYLVFSSSFRNDIHPQITILFPKGIYIDRSFVPRLYTYTRVQYIGALSRFTNKLIIFKRL